MKQYLNLFRPKLCSVFVFMAVFCMIQNKLYAETSTTSTYTDSLLAALKTSKEDSNKVYLLEQISLSYSKSDPTMGLKYGEEAHDLAVKLGLKNRIAASYTIMATSYSALSNYQNGIDLNRKALEIYNAEKNKDGMAAVNTNLSQIYSATGQYAKALKCNFNALTIYDEIRQLRNKAIVYENIAEIYYRLKEFSKSLSNYNNAINLYNSHGTEGDRARCQGNMGRVYMDTGNFQKAKSMFQKAYQYNVANNYENLEIINLINLGLVESKMNNFSESLNFLWLSLQKSNKLRLPSFIAINEGNIGSVYLSWFKENASQLHLDSSIYYLKNAIQLCDSIQFEGPKIEFLESLIEAHSQDNNFKEAYFLLTKKTKIEDSIQNLHLKEQIQKLETQREIELKNKDLLIKDKQLSINNLKDQRKTFIYSYIIFLLALILFLSIRYYKRKERKQSQFIHELKQVQSHEIRGPIVTILGLSKLLKDEKRSIESKKQLNQGIYETAEKLNQLVSQIIKNSNDKKNNAF